MNKRQFKKWLSKGKHKSYKNVAQMVVVDWFIHYVFDATNIPNIVNIHTHGLENYNHLNFQLVLAVGTDEAKYILNTMGRRVQKGEVFHEGDMVSGIFEDCDITLKKYHETGRDVLRIIIPDRNNRFPGEEGCEEPYSHQEDSCLDIM